MGKDTHDCPSCVFILESMIKWGEILEIGMDELINKVIVFKTKDIRDIIFECILVKIWIDFR